MSCINKASKAYKALMDVYGDDLSEAFVRGYPSNRGKSEDIEYDIPGKQDIKEWLSNEKMAVLNNIDRAFEINPYLSENGIRSMLNKVIHSKDGKFYVTRGDTRSGSVLLTEEVIETIYKPNLRVMQRLEAKYPEIFSIKQSDRNEYTTSVEITPLEAPVIPEGDKELPAIANSVQAYRKIVDANNGRKPMQFTAGEFKWQLNKNGLYNLVDRLNNNIYMRNFDLETGEVIPEVDPGTPANEYKRDALFRSIMQLIKEQRFDEYLAIKGIDTADIYEDLRDAQTDGDLNKVSQTILKALCH
jgi:hypothetical protein